MTGIGASCSVEKVVRASTRPATSGETTRQASTSGGVHSVKSPVEKLGTPILTIGGVENPWGGSNQPEGGGGGS